MKLSIKKAKELGIDVPAAPKRVKAVKKINPELFRQLAMAHGLPEPFDEYPFAKGRKWKFDWLFQSNIPYRGGRRDGWLYQRVAVEIQGGLFSHGRHTRGAALLREYEKINEAQILGYKILFVTHEQVESGEVFALVKRALYGDSYATTQRTHAAQQHARGDATRYPVAGSDGLRPLQRHDVQRIE